MNVEPLNLQISSKGAQDDLARFSSALDKTASAWDKFDSTIASGANRIDGSLKKSAGALANFAKASEAMSKIRVSGADGITRFAAAMNALSRVKALNDSQVKNLQAFSRAMSNLRMPTNVGRLVQLSSAIGNFKSPTLAQTARLQAFFKAVSSYQPPRSLGASAQLFAAIGQLKVPTTAQIGRLDALFRALGQARTIPNATAIAASLMAVATAAHAAGTAAAATPNAFRAMANGALQAQGRIGGLKGALMGLAAFGGAGNGRAGFGYQLGTLFTSLFSAFTLGQFVRNIADATNSAMSLQKALFFSTGTAAGVGEGVSHFNKMVLDLGLNLKETQGPFARFLISAREAGLSVKESESVFRSVGMTLRTVGASNEQTTQTFYALQEMLAKGKVQAKEFTRQLAQYIPGAASFGAQALAMMKGAPVSIAEFYNAMKKGSIESAPFVKNLSKILEEQFSALQELQKARPDYALNRIKSTFQLFYQAIGNSGAVEAATRQLNTFVDSLVTKDGDLKPRMQDLANSIGRGFADIATKVGQAALWVVDHLELVIGALKAFAAIKLVGSLIGMVEAMGQMVARSTAMAIAARTAAIAQATQTAATRAATVAAAANAAAVSAQAAALGRLQLAQLGASRYGPPSPFLASPIRGAAGGSQPAGAGLAARGAGLAAGAGAAATAAFPVSARLLTGAASLTSLDVVPLVGEVTMVIQVILTAVAALMLVMNLFDSHAKHTGEVLAETGKKTKVNFLDEIGQGLSDIDTAIGGKDGKFTEQLSNLGKTWGGILVEGLKETFITFPNWALTELLGLVPGLKQRTQASKDKAGGDSKDVTDGRTKVFNIDALLREQNVVSAQRNADDARQRLESMGRNVDDATLSALSTGKQIEAVADRLGMSKVFAKNSIDIESHGDPNAGHGKKYQGLLQFDDQSWFEAIVKHGAEFSEALGNGTKNLILYNKQTGKYEVKDALTAQAILSWRTNMPDMNMFLGLARFKESAGKLAGKLGRNPTSGETYLTNLGAPQVVADYVNAAKANPDANASDLADKIWAKYGVQGVGKSNPAIFLQMGHAITASKALDNLNKRMQGKSSMDDADADPDKQNQEAITFLKDLSSSGKNTALYKESALREFEAQWAKRYSSFDELSPTGSLGTLKKTDLDDAKKIERADLDRKIDQTINPLQYDQTKAKEDLDVQAKRVAGLRDEADWQAKLNEEIRAGKQPRADDAEAAKKQFEENQKRKNQLESENELYKSVAENQLRMLATTKGFDPSMTAGLKEIVNKYDGPTLQSRIDQANTDGTTGNILQTSRNNMQTDVALSLQDRLTTNRDELASAGKSPYARSMEAARKEVYASIPGFNEIKGGMKAIDSFASSYMVTINGITKSAREWADEVVRGEEAMRTANVIAKQYRDLVDQQDNIGLNPYERQYRGNYKDYLRGQLGDKAKDSDSLGTLEDIGNKTTVIDPRTKLATSATALSQALAKIKTDFENPPGFKAWADAVEPFAQKMEGIKKDFVQGIADAFTDKALGKKADFKAVFTKMREDATRSSIENTISGVIKGGTSILDGAAAQGGIIGTIGKVLGGGKNKKLPDDPVKAQLQAATTLQTGSDTLLAAANTWQAIGTALATAAGITDTSGTGTPGVSPSAVGAALGSGNSQDITVTAKKLASQAIQSVVPPENFGNPVLSQAVPNIQINKPSFLDNILGAGGGLLGGIGKVVNQSGAIPTALMLGLDSLFSTKDKTGVTHEVHGAIGTPSQVSVTGTNVAGHANIAGVLLNMLAQAGLKSFNGFGNGGASPGAPIGNGNDTFNDATGSVEDGGYTGQGYGGYKEGGIVGQPVTSYRVGGGLFDGAPHYSEGTPNTSGGMPAIVHPEEAVIPLSRGRKIPVDMGDAGPSNVNHFTTNYVINTPNADSFRQSESSINSKNQRVMKRAASRNLS